MEWIILFAVAVAFFWWRSARGQRNNSSGVPGQQQWPGSGGTRSTPDGRRFATWEEAFNRPVSGERFLIEYADENGEVTNREIEPESIQLRRSSPVVYIRAQCHLRNERRTFRSDRVLAARNIRTGRQISDLGQYLRGRY